MCGDRFPERCEDCLAMPPCMSFAGSLPLPASLLGSGTVYLCLCPPTSCVQLQSMTTSVRHEPRLVDSAQNHERLAGAESIELGVPVETFLGGITLGP